MNIVVGGVLTQDARYEFDFYNTLLDLEQYIRPENKLVSVKILEVEKLFAEGYINYRLLIFTELIPVYEYIINFKLPKNDAIDRAL
jgi:hypothetical protein